MSDVLWANVLTAIPATIAAVAAFLVALKGLQRTKKVEKSVNGLLRERDAYVRAEGQAAGERVGELRGEEIAAIRRRREDLAEGRD